ncbi:two-component system, chemotaxis family, response regulator CheY [Nitrosomonas sp. Nm51]|uniref:response regulator n=1 Tax=Nitrosomonas sp. Nm51 TaxID=133720 RepID=UPI0008D596C4|nr:response regulator [Nitrosomonas sp. Nm51]SER22181.1 two-component system, chemotaxis family, response regulator CheY [Nitrosomonas sp. Nm51]
MLSNHMKFLVVDNIANMHEQIAHILKDLGFWNVEETDNGEIALQKLQAGEFDFIISNWHVSAVDGLTILRNIRAVEKLSDVPVLMVATEIKKKHIVDAVQAGANGFLARPFTATMLFEKLSLIVRNHKNRWQ